MRRTTAGRPRRRSRWAGPDLSVASVIDPPATARAGTSFRVSETIQNSSSFNPSAFRVQYYLSIDGSKKDRLPTGNRMVAGLAGGASSSATTSLTIPTRLRHATTSC